MCLPRKTASNSKIPKVFRSFHSETAYLFHKARRQFQVKLSAAIKRKLFSNSIFIHRQETSPDKSQRKTLKIKIDLVEKVQTLPSKLFAPLK